MTAFMLPVQSGMTELARELVDEIERHDRSEIEDYCERVGIERMTWHLAVLPSGDYLVIHVQGREADLVLSRLAASQHAFERWLHAKLAEITAPNSGSVQRLLALIDLCRAGDRASRERGHLEHR